MPVFRCPQCQLPFTLEEAPDGNCPGCRGRVNQPVTAVVDATAVPVRRWLWICVPVLMVMAALGGVWFGRLSVEADPAAETSPLATTLVVNREDERVAALQAELKQARDEKVAAKQAVAVALARVQAAEKLKTNAEERAVAAEQATDKALVEHQATQKKVLQAQADVTQARQEKLALEKQLAALRTPPRAPPVFKPVDPVVVGPIERPLEGLRPLPPPPLPGQNPPLQPAKANDRPAIIGEMLPEQRAIVDVDGPGVARKIDDHEVIFVNRLEAEFTLPAVDRARKVMLTGRAKTLIVTSVKGASTLDLRRLGVSEIRVTGPIDGQSHVILSAPKAKVTFAQVLGRSRVEALAAEGKVSFGEVDGDVEIQIQAQEVELREKVNGGATKIRALLDKGGVLRFKELHGGARLVWKNVNREDAAPKLEAGLVHGRAKVEEEKGDLEKTRSSN